MKKTIKLFALLLVAAATSACTTETISRATPITAPFLGADAGAEQIKVAPNFRVQKVNVVVPGTLQVSEANGIKPRADVVWREDPYGNRLQQVHGILEEGLSKGAQTMTGTQPVVLDVQLVRFHAQTERVRYSSLPSKHEIEFLLTVRDAKSGAVIVPAHMVDATFAALGGDAAISADHAGITQRMRIEEQLSNVIVQELSKPITL